ncbi:hypothetical protein ER308_04580 [Egibacter rhizosphaerae]|uniref:Uncharacterized protein n=1 Tax=Egibacter rhizosphaerae TaxID=1670831 RepID=A0A411YCK3_9ACTN|nr:ATP-binding protein [Egibacter rhizosphaerae]QBI18892.1 hypothetical protein ER308_04580 [Egibacter rhizosphaerae]
MGRDKRDLDGFEMERLLHERSLHHAYDESPVPDASLEDLDHGILERVFPTREESDSLRVLRNSRVVAAEAPTRPTIAGLVAFGSQPDAHLPQAVIRAVVYRGSQMDGDVVDEHDLDGPGGQQVDRAVELVGRHMRRGSSKDVGREDRPQFDLGAVMEAVVNAVAHRDYAVVGSRIRLLEFDDRLEIASPGGLPNTLDVESMRYRQYTRNQLLVTFLSKLTTAQGRRYIEERGEGVERIVQRSTELSGREPEFHQDGHELRLTIWGA